MLKPAAGTTLALLSGLLLGVSGCRSRSAATDAPASAAHASEPQAVTSASVRGAEAGPDPCALLEDSEVEALFGVATKEGRRAGKICRWKPESGPGYVTLQLEPRNGQSIYDFARRVVREDKELPGIGDQAFQSGLTVGVRLGERFLSLVVAPNEPKKTPRPSDAVRLAKKAIRRLPAATL